LLDPIVVPLVAPEFAIGADEFLDPELWDEVVDSWLAFHGRRQLFQKIIVRIDCLGKSVHRALDQRKRCDPSEIEKSFGLARPRWFPAWIAIGDRQAQFKIE
jgi:hypothetical protein